MKFFSLIKQDVHVIPGKKVIPKEEFTDIKEANDLLKLAKHEIETKLNQNKEECAQRKKEAFDKGFEQGLGNLNHHILKLDHELKAFRKEIHEKILPIALKAARKILGEELKIHPDRIVEIVQQALKPVTQHRKVRIFVNRSDLDLLEKKKANIKKILEQVELFSIEERDDIEPSGCIIETEAGIINAQLENQWRALEAAFEAFMKHE